MGSIYSHNYVNRPKLPLNKISRFLFSTHKWSPKLEFCGMIADIITYTKKYILKFSSLFWQDTIFQNKLICRIQYCTKILNIYNIFLKCHLDPYHLCVKKEKIQIVLRGKLNEMTLFQENLTRNNMWRSIKNHIIRLCFAVHIITFVHQIYFLRFFLYPFN